MVCGFLKTLKIVKSETLIPNKQKDHTVFFMTDIYKTKDGIEEWYKNEKITPETKDLKTF